MIIFKCSNCGKGLSSGDDTAGQNAICPFCSQHTTIPLQSESDCHLVFTSGSPDNGEVVTEAQLQDGFKNGKFTSDDLIFHEGRWCPISHVYELPDLQPSFQPSPDEPDIALHFSDLPSVNLKAIGKKANVANTRKKSGSSSGVGKKLTTLLIIIVLGLLAVVGAAIVLGLTGKA